MTVIVAKQVEKLSASGSCSPSSIRIVVLGSCCGCDLRLLTDPRYNFPSPLDLLLSPPSYILFLSLPHLLFLSHFLFIIFPPI